MCLINIAVKRVVLINNLGYLLEIIHIAKFYYLIIFLYSKSVYYQSYKKIATFILKDYWPLSGVFIRIMHYALLNEVIPFYWLLTCMILSQNYSVYLLNTSKQVKIIKLDTILNFLYDVGLCMLCKEINLRY